MQCDIKQYWDLTDEDLRNLYDHAQVHRLFDHVAYDARPTRDLFQLFARRAECFAAIRAENRWLGFFYLTHFEGATARLHLALPRDKAPAGNPADQDSLIRQVLDWCLSTFDFQSLFIVTPAADAYAAALWPRLGARHLADVPGLCWLEQKKKAVPGRLFLLRP